MLTRRMLLLLSAVPPFLSQIASAQPRAWPQKAVRVIVPFAAGGNTDGIARIICQQLSEAFGQQFIVENHGGAGGEVAATQVARAPADGYTLFVAALPQIVVVPAIRKVAYDPTKDFAPISNIATNPFVLAVHKDVPVKTLAEFVDYVRPRPRQLSYGSAGTGSVTHLSMALLLRMADLEMIHVSYKGNAPAMADLIAGHIPVMFTNLSDALPQAAAGRIRLLAVSSSKRVTQVPDVPTVSESGYPKFKTLTWNGLMAPAGTPKGVIATLAKEVARAVRNPQTVERFKSYGVDPLGNSPEEFAEMIASDIALWSEAVKISGVAEK